MHEDHARGAKEPGVDGLSNKKASTRRKVGRLLASSIFKDCIRSPRIAASRRHKNIVESHTDIYKL